MHVRIKFHAHSDIEVNTEIVSRKKKKKIIRDLRLILEAKAPNITGNRLGLRTLSTSNIFTAASSF
jgi:hypothetical protein